MCLRPIKDYTRTIWREHKLYAIVSGVLAMLLGVGVFISLCSISRYPAQLSVDTSDQRGYLYAYTFSSLAQSLAALLGVLGIFVVYSLERYSGNFSEADNKKKQEKRENIKNVAFPLAVNLALLTVLSLLLIGKSEIFGHGGHVIRLKLGLNVPVASLVFVATITILGQLLWFSYMALSERPSRV